MKEEVLRLEQVDMVHSSRVVLRQLQLCLFKGETVGVLGLNGAGKTAFSNYLSGKASIQSGRLYYYEKRIEPCNTVDSKALRIRCIRSQTSLIPDMSIAENFYIHTSLFEKPMLYSRKTVEKQVQQHLDFLEISLSAHALASSLSAIQQHIVAIAIAYFCKEHIVVVDDIINDYSALEIELFCQFLQRFKGLGMSFLFLTHTVKAAIAFSDRLYILSGGTCVKHFEKPQYDPVLLSQILLGHANEYQKSAPATPGPPITVHRLLSNGRTLKSSGGTITGIYDFGTSLCRMEHFFRYKLFSDPVYGEIDGAPFRFCTLQEAFSENIAFLNGNAYDRELFYNMSIPENISIIAMRRWRGLRSIRKNAKIVLNDLGISTLPAKKKLDFHSVDVCERLTILLNRLIVFGPKLLIYIRPFSYLDSMATDIVCEFLEKLTQNGTCVILLGNDMSVISPVCDRVLLLNDTDILDELDRAALSDTQRLAQRISHIYAQSQETSIF